jgi:molybdenum cofactor biosynthesis enzyme MoaA
MLLASAAFRYPHGAPHRINRALPQVMRSLKAAGKHVLVSSNATLLKARWQQALIDSQLAESRVSLDATTPESYTEVCGKPPFPLIQKASMWCR